MTNDLENYAVMEEFFQTRHYDSPGADWRTVGDTAVDPDDTVLKHASFALILKAKKGESFKNILKGNQCHEPAGSPKGGQFCSSKYRDEVPGEPVPKVGETFLVYRLGKDLGGDSLENRNAGNADSVAWHLLNIDDIDKPKPSSGTGNAIHAYEVTLEQEFGGYKGFTGRRANLLEAVTENAPVGRRDHGGHVSYSFEKTGYKAKRIGTVPLPAVRAVLTDLNASTQGSFDEAGTRLGAKAIREAFKRLGLVQKYNKCHDPKTGQFCSGSGYAFVSPSTGENLSPSVAAWRMGSEAQAKFVEISKKLDALVGLQSRVISAVGAWKDGAENTTMTTYKGATYEQVKVAACMKGLLGQQKMVIPFQSGRRGTSRVFKFSLPEQDPAKLNDFLVKNGVEYHTLVPHDSGTEILVFSETTDRKLTKSINLIAKQSGVSVSMKKGTGELFGSWDSREEGRQKYEQVIDAFLKNKPAKRRQWDMIRSEYGV